MIVIKNINNNVSLCLDSKNNEVIVFGKGVGFVKPPYEIPLEKIDKTFYNISDEQIELLNLIPEDVLEVSSLIMDYANKKLGNAFPSGAVFTLADHISFSIKRQEQNIHLKMPVLQEIEQTYVEECYVGYKALELIHERLHIKLPDQEAISIALHLINYRQQNPNQEEQKYGNLVNSCVEMIGDTLHIRIDKKSFSYYRFVTHLYYLVKRVFRNDMIQSENEQVFDMLKKDFPDIYACTNLIDDMMQEKLNKRLSDEEKLYLILHINRLYSRENMTEH